MKELKLNVNTMNWSHFAPRKRYIKDDSGVVVATRYDRLFIGLSPAGRDWIANKYHGDSPVMTFLLGAGNVVFLHREGDSKMFVNENAGAQAREYVKFYQREVAKAMNLDIDSVELITAEDLPTAVHTRASRGGVDSLEAAIAQACGRDISALGI